MTDIVNHPPHYKTNGLEAIEVLEAFFEDDPLGWQIGKYILRYKKKNGLEDLQKAEWYLKRLIGKVKGEDVIDAEEVEPPARVYGRSVISLYVADCSKSWEGQSGTLYTYSEDGYSWGFTNSDGDRVNSGGSASGKKYDHDGPFRLVIS